MSFTQALQIMTDARKSYNWIEVSKVNLGATGGANALYGGIFDNSKTWTTRYPCHAYIRHNPNTNTLWSAFSYRDEQVARAYFNWLLNDSPWSKTGIIPKNSSKEDQFNVGFVFTDLDKTPANLLHNFLIATRMAAEWSKYIKGWYQLTLEGINPSLAFLMMTVFTPFDPNQAHPENCFFNEKKSILTDRDKYDWPLDMSRCNEEYVKNFLTGKTVGISSQMYYPTSETLPVNTLWGNFEDKNTYINLLKNLYKGFFHEETVKYTSFNGPREKKLQQITQEDIIRVIKLEEMRFSSLLAAGRRKAA